MLLVCIFTDIIFYNNKDMNIANQSLPLALNRQKGVVNLSMYVFFKEALNRQKGVVNLSMYVFFKEGSSYCSLA